MLALNRGTVSDSCAVSLGGRALPSRCVNARQIPLHGNDRPTSVQDGQGQLAPTKARWSDRLSQILALACEVSGG